MKNKAKGSQKFFISLVPFVSFVPQVPVSRVSLLSLFPLCPFFLEFLSGDNRHSASPPTDMLPTASGLIMDRFEGVARGFILYKHEPVGRLFIER